MKDYYFKSIIIFLAIFFVGIFLLPKISWAATYYVSTRGNDSDSGNQNQPWRTIQHAADTVVEGDTVIVKDGIYTESVTISRSGSNAAQMLTFKSENKWGAVISTIAGGSDGPRWAPFTSYVANDKRMAVQKTIAPGQNTNNSIWYYTQLNSSCLSGALEPAWGATLNSEVNDGTCRWRTSGINANTFFVIGNWVKVDGFKFVNHAGSTGGTGGNFGLEATGNNDVITNNWFYKVWKAAISSGGNYNQVTNNYVSEGEMAFVMNGTGWLLENNETYRLQQWSDGDADDVRFFGTNGIVRGNKFWGYVNTDQGSSHSDCFQTFDAADGSGYITNITIENNYCHSMQGMTVTDEHGNFGNGLSVRNNLFKIEGNSPLDNWAINNVVLYNNTFILNGNYPYCLANAGHPITCTFKNNIIFGGSGKNMCTSGNNVTYDCDYNLIYRNDFIFPQIETHGIVNQYPQFVNPANGDYSLKFPVMPDPIINRIGNNVQSYITSFSGDWMSCSLYHPDVSGNLDTAYIYHGNISTQRTKLCLYNATGAAPSSSDQKVYCTDVITSSALGWVSYPVTGSYYVDRTLPYWLCGLSDPLTTGWQVGWSQMSGTGVYNKQITGSYNNPPDKLGESYSGPSIYISSRYFSIKSGGTATNPAVDSGVNLSSTGFSTDKNGVSRPQGSAWDIGAYEYVGAAPPPDTTPPQAPTGVVIQ